MTPGADVLQGAVSVGLALPVCGRLPFSTFIPLDSGGPSPTARAYGTRLNYSCFGFLLWLELLRTSIGVI